MDDHAATRSWRSRRDVHDHAGRRDHHRRRVCRAARVRSPPAGSPATGTIVNDDACHADARQIPSITESTGVDHDGHDVHGDTGQRGRGRRPRARPSAQRAAHRGSGRTSRSCTTSPLTFTGTANESAERSNVDDQAVTRSWRSRRDVHDHAGRRDHHRRRVCRAARVRSPPAGSPATGHDRQRRRCAGADARRSRSITESNGRDHDGHDIHGDTGARTVEGGLERGLQHSALLTAEASGSSRSCTTSPLTFTGTANESGERSNVDDQAATRSWKTTKRSRSRWAT